MRVIAPYNFCKEHALDEIVLFASYSDREIYLNLINKKLNRINDEIKKFSLSDDIDNTLFSKEIKFRHYRKLLTSIRNDLEESLLKPDTDILFNYENFSIFYAAIMSEYNKIMSRIDAKGYDIIDRESALIINTILNNEPSMTELIDNVDDLLFPEYNKFIDSLEEKFWIIDNDGSFPTLEEMAEESSNVGIFIHEYEIEYFIEYLEFFKETIEKKPIKKTYDTLKLYINPDKYIYIEKKHQLNLIEKLLGIIEKWIPGDRVLYISSSEYILFAMLIKGFYLKLSERFQDYSYDISEVEHNFVSTSFIQTRLFLPYVKPIENYKEPTFNRYFYDN